MIAKELGLVQHAIKRNRAAVICRNSFLAGQPLTNPSVQFVAEFIEPRHAHDFAQMANDLSVQDDTHYCHSRGHSVVYSVIVSEDDLHDASLNV